MDGAEERQQNNHWEPLASINQFIVRLRRGKREKKVTEKVEKELQMAQSQWRCVCVCSISLPSIRDSSLIISEIIE